VSPQVDKSLDLDALLAPIDGENPAGADLKRLGVHDKIDELRKTDDPEGAVGAGEMGSLRKGEVRVADWHKVAQLCIQELATRGKDLQVAVWLTEALIKQRGLSGLAGGLKLTQGLLQTFWPNLYPPVEEEGDLDVRAAKLDGMDRMISRSLSELVLTKSSDGQNCAAWEWGHVRTMAEGASRAKPDDRANLEAEVADRREKLARAVLKTSREFYEEFYGNLNECIEHCEKLRISAEELFRADPGFSAMENDLPTFMETRNALRDCNILVEDFLTQKGGLTIRKPEPGGIEAGTGADGAAGGGQAVPGATGNLPLDPVNRADAIRRLNAIAIFFQRTEPHSPVSYLVQRAARWGEMPLDKWLEEVVNDESVLGRIREHLGIRKEEPPASSGW
jgi:type VI secretion system protein ImpA